MTTAHFSKIHTLLMTHRVVFSTQNLAMLWGIQDRRQLLESIKYYVRKKQLSSVTRGIYKLDRTDILFEPASVASALIPFSYISLDTALFRHGIIYQFTSAIHSMSQESRTVTIQDVTYIFHTAKPTILSIRDGLIIESQEYTIASPERAVVDALYLSSHRGFDHISELQPHLLTQIAAQYGNARLMHDVQSLIQRIDQ